MKTWLPGNRFHRRSVLLAWLLAPGFASAQVAGESVNMVSGTQWPGGDPFLQRQNEPSIAVSSANPMHLLAGANDYRSVDVPAVPDATKMAADAWQGVFKSYDGGQTWKSYLMPGYPQDASYPCNSPLRRPPTSSDPAGPACFPRYNAAADPIVRAGTDGMFYFGGIAFARGTNDGAVILNRFLDLNNKENGDPASGTDSIRWIDVKVLDTGGAYFADKPWIAVDVPRAGAQTCSVAVKDASGSPVTRTFPGGALYAVWARIYSDTRADIMFSASLDCGDTWSAPLQVNDNKSYASQGAAVSVDPRTGYVYIAWRRFGLVGASPPQPDDAIFVARSFTKGKKFTRPKRIASLEPFEQASAGRRFRTEAFPALTSSVDATGTRSWTHVAWSQRTGNAADGDGRIMMAQALVSPPPPSFDEWSDPGDDWGAPPFAIDAGPVVDGAGRAFARGHQFMPQLTFSQGRIVALYYDSRLDHTRNYYQPHQSQDPCQPVGTCWVPNDAGSWYDEERGPVGERPGLDWATVELDDGGMTQVRHTVDVRMAVATPSSTPVFTSVPVSRMPFGMRGDEADEPLPGDPWRTSRGRARGFAGDIALLDDLAATTPNLLRLQDLQVNPPNLPMFKNGTVPFIGDYIDVQGPAFVRTDTGWAFNSQWTPAPVFHAVWTSNQDVVPPYDGDWTHYTPVRSPALGTASRVDGTTVPACVTGQTGSRNQNVYTARITDGLFVTSPQNAKWLSDRFARNFVVSAHNATAQDRTFVFSFRQPANAIASWRLMDGVPDVNAPDATSFRVRIPARSTGVQTLFMLATTAPAAANPATLVVNVDEVVTVNGVDAPGSYSGFVTLNPPGVTFDLAQPDGTNDSIRDGEVLTVSIGAAHLSNANLSNANLSNAHLSNANLSNANLSNANLSNANLSNANLSNTSIDAAHLSNANLSNANLSNANLSNSTLSDANLSNANLSNANLSNASLTDIDYTVTNTGNTSEGFDVRLVTTDLGESNPVQLIVSRFYSKPVAFGCDLVEQPDNRLVVNAGVVTPTDAGAPGAQAPLATFALAPGETIQVTLRTYLTLEQARALARSTAPHLTPHGNESGATTAFLVTTPASPAGIQVGVPYDLLLQATGGTGTLSWGLAQGSGPLPGGLSITSVGNEGHLSGTPTQAGSFPVVLEVTDSANPQNLTQKALTLNVAMGTTKASITPSTTSAVHGQPVTVTATIAPASGPTGSMRILDNGVQVATAPVGSASLTVPGPLAVGDHALSVAYDGDGSWNGSGAEAPKVTVAPASTTTGLATAGARTYGQVATFTAVVAAAAPGTGTPTGSVDFRDGTATTPFCSAALDGSGVATCTSDALSGGAHEIRATYRGDGNYLTSTGTATQQIDKASTTTGAVASPATILFGGTIDLVATVTPASSGKLAPSGNVHFYVDGVLRDPAKALVAGSADSVFAGLPVGGHVLSAAYDGDGNYAGSSGSASVLVGQANVLVDVYTTPTQATFGDAVTVSAQLSSAGGVPTGVVSFYLDGATPLGQAAVDVTGRAALAPIVSIPGGTHAVSATYEGDVSFAAASSSISAALKVLPAPDTIALATSPNPSGPGQAVQLTCTVSSPLAAPGGSVTFLDGTTAIATVAAPTSTGVTPAGARFGTWTTSTAALASGVHSLTCSYAGDGSFVPNTSGALTQIVGPLATTTTLGVTPTALTVGQTATMEATVTPVTTGAGAPTGVVSFTDNGAAVGTAAIGPGGVARLSVTLAAGAHAIGAAYLGDALFGGSSAASTVNVSVTYRFTGFLSPLRSAGTYDAPTNSGTQKFGSAIPIKWQLQDASGAYVGDLSTAKVLEAWTNASCKGPPTATSKRTLLYMPTSGATGNSTFRYGTSTYIFNWDTSSGYTPGCYDIVLTLADGTVRSTLVTLK